jgi:predicted NAD/FAD-dependent oxidoreductase
LCIENEKGKDLGDKFVLIVQMSEEFSIKYEKENLDNVVQIIVERLEKLLPELKGCENLFVDLKLWGHALPKNKVTDETVRILSENNLYLIGDCLIGKGRIDGSIISGFELYDNLKAKF